MRNPEFISLEKQLEKELLPAGSAYGKKIRGRGTVAEMKSAESLGLMKRLVVESFKQNPNSDAAKKLLQYENFTHNTNQLIDKAFLEGLKLAQKELDNLKGGKGVKESRIETPKNIFTVKPTKTVDKKAVAKAKIATQFIGFAEGIKDSSTGLYGKQAGQYANTGNYSSDDVIFVSVLGKRGNESIRKTQQDKTIREAIKALKAGATVITDNEEYVRSSSYNEGEKRLADNLKHKGYYYSEIVVDGNKLGAWSKSKNNKPLKESREGFTNYSKADEIYLLEEMAENLQEAYGTETEFLDSEEFRLLGYKIGRDLSKTKAMVMDGVVYVNQDKASLTDMVHEQMHLFIPALKEVDSEMYKELEKEALNSNYVDYYRTLYPELNDAELAEEIISDVSGLASKGYIEKPTWWDRFNSLLNRVLNKFFGTQLPSGGDYTNVRLHQLVTEYSSDNLKALYDKINQSDVIKPLANEGISFYGKTSEEIRILNDLLRACNL
jgi:hypothetical protein